MKYPRIKVQKIGHLWVVFCLITDESNIDMETRLTWDEAIKVVLSYT